MAFDKVIDSATLDAGMTATANAIREKTGGIDPIVWDAVNGFKAAVEGIEAGSGGEGFSDGNLSFSEHIVTVGEDNGVTNHVNLMSYFFSMVGEKSIFAYSLIGVADTYNQAIMGSGFNCEGIENKICYRYRDGYISVPAALGNAAYDAALVVGTQYKVYCTEYRG